MHGTEFLKALGGQETGKPAGPVGPVVALYGTERALKVSVVRALGEVVLGPAQPACRSAEEEASITRFAGKETDLAAVRDELLTVSMWSDRRLVVVEEADTFVTAHRAGLEKYLAKPARKSVLVLDVKSWPKNTRLAKVVAKIGLDVDCSELKGAPLLRWLQETARDQHGKQLTRDAAVLMTELAGNGFGLLEQELAKLAAYVGGQQRIGVEDVRTLVGGWKAETTWVMIESLCDGNVGRALSLLEKLLVAGEAPLKVFGGISFSFRRLALATELALQGQSLTAALRQAGVFPRDVERSASYLRRIGRPRAESIYNWLVETDAALKGGSRLPDRVQLEQLLVRLSGAL